MSALAGHGGAEPKIDGSFRHDRDAESSGSGQGASAALAANGIEEVCSTSA
jgi:hypothetical protein